MSIFSLVLETYLDALKREIEEQTVLCARSIHVYQLSVRVRVRFYGGNQLHVNRW